MQSENIEVKVLSLVPSWARYYEEFWQTIRRRNLWLIKLRYGAVVMLLSFLFGSEYLLKFTFSDDQNTAILLISLSIFVYNIILHYLRRFIVCTAEKFNPLHLSLIQMMLDLTALWLLVYYTGGIETPLYMLFVFHMIIGSLILPGFIIYTIAAWFVLGFIGLVTAEYFGLVEHHSINGFLSNPVYDDASYVFTFTAAFAFVIFMSVMIANRIAKQLYKMEQDLILTLDKLQKSEIEKQKYIIGVVHEIKTPLTAVHSYLDVILQKYLGPLNKDVEEKLVRTRLRSVEALELINDVLKISKLKLMDDITKEDIDLGKTLQDIIDKQSPFAGSKNVQISFNDQRKNKKLIQGDLFLMEMAFSNIINNAVKYMCGKGLVEITIREKGAATEIEICDNGVGIPENEKEKIFSEFFRASNIKTSITEGSGLGLSIVKQIIERHNGEIKVASPSRLANQKRPGSSFTIVIP